MHRATKRKRVVLTLEDKLEVAQDREAGKISCFPLLTFNGRTKKLFTLTFSSSEGFSVDTIAEKFNIGASTVSEICKRRFEIEQALEKNKMNGVLKNRKTLREPSKPVVETELYNWYLDQDVKPTQNDLIEKAKEINVQLNQEEGDEDEEECWNPTKGWLFRFKERYGIKAETRQPAEQRTWQTALEAAEYLLDYINTRDFLLKDVITVRMIRDKIASEPEADESLNEISTINNY